jgi:hypothetical protein
MIKQLIDIEISGSLGIIVQTGAISTPHNTGAGTI